jgi:hypothetical protein
VTAEIEIVPVKSFRDFIQFCRVPRLLYGGQTGFAPSLDVERWTLYSHWLNPHYRRVRSQTFLARTGGHVVGRIEAQIFKSSASTATSPAQFGSLDAIDDLEVVAALMQTAENWLFAYGAELIQGPFSPSYHSEAGLLVEGFWAEPMIFTPWHPPYLGQLLHRLGYVKVHDLISYRYDIKESDRSSTAIIANRPEWRDRLRFRSFHVGKSISDARIVVDIFNDGWRESWGFVPLGLEEYQAMSYLLWPVVTSDYAFMIELDDEPVGFVIIIPNIHDLTTCFDGRLSILRGVQLVGRLVRRQFRSGRLDLFGLRQQFHRTAIGGALTMAMMEELQARSRRISFDFVEFGWVLDDNAGMRRAIEISGARVDKIHRIYEKHLEGCVKIPGTV